MGVPDRASGPSVVPLFSEPRRRGILRSSAGSSYTMMGALLAPRDASNAEMEQAESSSTTIYLSGDSLGFGLFGPNRDVPISLAMNLRTKRIELVLRLLVYNGITSR